MLLYRASNLLPSLSSVMLPFTPPGPQEGSLLFAGFPEQRPASPLCSLNVQVRSWTGKQGWQTGFTSEQKSWHLKVPAASCNFKTSFAL